MKCYNRIIMIFKLKLYAIFGLKMNILTLPPKNTKAQRTC